MICLILVNDLLRNLENPSGKFMKFAHQLTLAHVAHLLHHLRHVDIFKARGFFIAKKNSKQQTFKVWDLDVICCLALVD